MANSIFFNDDARKKVKSGIDISVNAIKTTLGGCGRTSIIFEGGLVSITADGVTVARSINLADPIENIGATIVRNSTEKQLSDSGDGTSAAAILTQKILEYGFKAIDKSVDSSELKKGIDIAVDFVSNEIISKAEKIGDDNEKIKNIATISANNDVEIGELIADAFKQIGNDGDLFIEESKSYNTSVRIEKGLKIDRGYMSPLFCNPETMEAELINPYIFLYEGKIDKFAQVKPILDDMMKLQKRDILIICENVEGEALQTLALNRLKSVLNVVCVNAPHFGERRKYAMEDIAMITGGNYVSVEKGIKEVDISHCGTCEKVLVTKNDTTIIGGNGDKEDVEKTLNQIDALISQSESDFEITMLKQRKAKVKGKLAIIAVGGNSQIEMKEKIDRIDDSIRSVKCAIELGYTIGGGIAFLRCIDKLEAMEQCIKNKDQRAGVRVVRKAIEAPLRQILENSGMKKRVWWFSSKQSINAMVKKLLNLEDKYGFNVKTGKIEDMFSAGIIDAAKVCVTSLSNAASVSGTILTAESLIC